MSEAFSVAFYQGYVTVEDAGPQGMIALRGDLADGAFVQAVQAAGLAVPGLRQIVQAGGRAAAWMSPDEVLLLLPYADVAAVIGGLEAALAGSHFLAADVSDARAVFRVQGAGAREVIAKLCPVDTAPAAFAEGTFRRTRAAQVAVAVWMSGPQEVTLFSFRSVGEYVFELLRNAAQPGSQVHLYGA